MIEQGYTNIYLCGHSLGATKILYTYNKFVKDNDDILKYIKSIIFLSLIDLENCFKFFAGSRYNDLVKYASLKKEQNKGLEMMPNASFLHPLSIRTYLLYNKDNKELNISRYSDDNYNFEELNNIKIPLLMRWGSEQEFITQKPEELIHILKNKIKNSNLNIGFVKGADHNYRKKEDYVAKEIIDFINNIAI